MKAAEMRFGQVVIWKMPIPGGAIPITLMYVAGDRLVTLDDQDPNLANRWPLGKLTDAFSDYTTFDLVEDVP